MIKINNIQRFKKITMGRYTVTGNPLVEAKVEEVLEKIKDDVVRRFKPKSIILHGSFGRGEGAVIVNNGNLTFLSDFEITVVTPKHIGKDLEILAFEVGKEICAAIGLWRNKPGKYNSYRVRKPTIENYELKYGSRIVYGENYLDKIPDFKPEDIPLWEGIRLMFNRMAESLNYFSVRYKESEPSEEEKRKLLYWTYKIVLACQDALLLSLRKYHYSYKIRNEMFQELFPIYFEELNEKLPKFLPLVVKATDYKIKPEKDSSEDVIELWFDTMEICDKTFRYVIEKDMGFTFNTYPEFQKKYLSHPNITKKYYCRRSGRPIYQNAVSIAKIVLARRKPPIRALSKIWMPWIHIMFSTVPLVYFSVSENWEVDESMLEKASRALKFFSYCSNSHDTLLAWEQAKQDMYLLWFSIVD